MNTIIQGDCLIKVKELQDNSVDSIVTDPPYELGFMGKSWDNTGIANNPIMWAECLRVLKPGGYLLSFGGTRTYHRMASAIEDAGFEVRDMIEWVYGSGFPKSRNIGLDVDKRNGITKNRGKAFVVAGQSGQRDKDTGGDLVPGSNTMGAYIAQNELSGWGTALKPAHEPICMARKPLAEKTVAENCLKWGTGGINIDESRVDYTSEYDKKHQDDIQKGQLNADNGKFFGGSGQSISSGNLQGRFPANLILEDCEEVRECFPEAKGASSQNNHSNGKIYRGQSLLESETKLEGHRDWYNDNGNASRFFKSILYYPKASKSERNKGLEDFEDKERVDYGGFHSDKGLIENNRNPENRLPTKNNHPTVKPIALMEYLIKMVTPKGGIVLDPFAGSGSTLVAAKQNGFQYIGIEMTEEYIPIIEARIKSISNTLF